MAVALQSGVAPEHWMADTRALFTALELLDEQNKELEKASRRRGR